jgi:hypothetical protein
VNLDAPAMIDKPDIVVRLRDMRGGSHLRSLREEAAAEIERLHIELAMVRKWEVWIDAHVAELTAESHGEEGGSD